MFNESTIPVPPLSPYMKTDRSLHQQLLKLVFGMIFIDALNFKVFEKQQIYHSYTHLLCHVDF